MNRLFISKKLLIVILLIGAFFRFYNLNWDMDFHLHPDERFLTMVGNAMRIPPSFLEYLDPQISKVNPANIGFNFFVYGTFPLTLNKLLAVKTGNDTYNDFTLQGRIVSGFFDLLTILIIFLLVRLLEKRYHFSLAIKYWACFLYSISVLPIQLSHFFAVDTFLSFFALTSFYFALRFAYTESILSIVLSAVTLGFAVSSKISALIIIPLNIFFITAIPLEPLFFKILRARAYTFSSLCNRYKKLISTTTFYRTALFKVIEISSLLLVYLLLTYVSTRLADPYLFEDKNFLNPSLNPLFVQNITMLKSWEGRDIWYPPAVHWMSKPPLLFSLGNLAFFGIGIPYFFVLLVGFYTMLKKPKYGHLLIIFVWMLLFFLYQSTQFVKAMRYFIVLYPFIAIFAAFGIDSLKAVRKKSFLYITICVLLIWPIAFSSIYLKTHTRISASEWIYQNIPNGSVLLSEYWDDPLPLYVKNTFGKQFSGEQLTVFDQDTDEKWTLMNQILKSGDYLILSSGRAWSNIPTVPQKYPRMSTFYKDLFAGKLPYKKIREFTSYPSLKYLGIPLEFPDQIAEEPFTVYDHPVVTIFKNTQKGTSYVY